jgi:uncharacterized protein (TIGR02246 family)
MLGFAFGVQRPAFLALAGATLRASVLSRYIATGNFESSEETMKRSIVGLLAVVVVALPQTAAAGPVEEVAEIAAPRLQALHDGNLDAYMAAFADNAVFQSAFSAFRVEGKAAIRGHFSQVFQIYPKRLVLPRQSVSRAYNDDLVISNSYSILYLTDQQGHVTIHPTRNSVVWARVGGRWQIVDQHGSQLPVGP